MAKSLRLSLILATLLGVAPMLSACHTTAGFGQDVSQGGRALTGSANANAPESPPP
jgi:predicted small secreted protein